MTSVLIHSDAFLEADSFNSPTRFASCCVAGYFLLCVAVAHGCMMLCANRPSLYKILSHALISFRYVFALTNRKKSIIVHIYIEHNYMTGLLYNMFLFSPHSAQWKNKATCLVTARRLPYDTRLHRVPALPLPSKFQFISLQPSRK